MKLLVISDYYMYKNKGAYYFESKEKKDFFNRYLRIFEKIKLVTRCICENELQSDRPILDNERIEYVPVPSFHGPIEYFKHYYSVGRVLKNITEGCDAALMQLPSTICQRAGKIVMNSHLPYATEVVYDAEDGWKSEEKIYLKYLWRRIDRSMRKICYEADGIACVTEKYLQQHYYSLKPNSFSAHYSSLALDFGFYGSPRSFPLKKEFVVAHTANKIFFEGRKGHKELIQAIKILQNKQTKVKLRFAGARVDDSPEKLIKYAQDLGIESEIEFVGFLNRKEMGSFLDNADIFVLPTKAEGLPRVLIEAMAKGLPCVASSVSGNSELLNTDFLVGYNDVYSLAEKIGKIIGNKDIYESESARNYNRSLEYEASILEKRRDIFYKALKDRVS